VIKFKHLEETGYTYYRHFVRSVRFAIRFYVLGLCAFVHAIWPDAFKDVVSEEIEALYKEFI
jgi:hypothetical protein